MPPRVRVADDSKCSGCQLCTLACSFFVGKERSFNPVRARIRSERIHGQNRFKVNLDKTCTNCGHCVKYCFYGVLTKDQEGER